MLTREKRVTSLCLLLGLGQLGGLCKATAPYQAPYQLVGVGLDWQLTPGRKLMTCSPRGLSPRRSGGDGMEASRNCRIVGLHCLAPCYRTAALQPTFQSRLSGWMDGQTIFVGSLDPSTDGASVVRSRGIVTDGGPLPPPSSIRGWTATRHCVKQSVGRRNTTRGPTTLPRFPKPWQGAISIRTAPSWKMRTMHGCAGRLADRRLVGSRCRVPRKNKTIS